jgi:hypothetical protein
MGRDEFRLFELLDTMFPNLVWSAQDHVSGWRGGAVDVCVYFPLERWLTIQVDGPTHRDACMSDRPLERQQEIDDKFGAAAVAAGWSVMRLNTDHSNGAWVEALGRAVAACRDAGNSPQIFYSEGG